MTAQQMVRGPRVHRATSLSVCHHHHSEVSTSTTTFRQLHVIMLIQHLWTPHVWPLCSIYYYYCCQVFPLLFSSSLHPTILHTTCTRLYFVILTVPFCSRTVLPLSFGCTLYVNFAVVQAPSFYKPYPSAAFHIFFPRKMMSRKYLLTEAINVHFRTNRRPIERYIWYDIVKLKMMRHRCSDTNVSNHG